MVEVSAALGVSTHSVYAWPTGNQVRCYIPAKSCDLAYFYSALLIRGAFYFAL